MVWVVKENGQYGIEGEPTYLIEWGLTKKKFIFEVYHGSSVTQRYGDEDLEFKDVLDWFEFKTQGQETTVDYTIDEVNLWKEWRVSNPDGTVDDWKTSDEFPNDNILFEIDVVATSDDSERDHLNNRWSDYINQ